MAAERCVCLRRHPPPDKRRRVYVREWKSEWEDVWECLVKIKLYCRENGAFVLLAQVDSCAKYWLGFICWFRHGSFSGKAERRASLCVSAAYFQRSQKRVLHECLLGPGARKMLWRDLLVPGAQLSQAQRGAEWKKHGAKSTLEQFWLCWRC